MAVVEEVEAAVDPEAVVAEGLVVLRVDGPVAGFGDRAACFGVGFGCHGEGYGEEGYGCAIGGPYMGIVFAPSFTDCLERGRVCRTVSRTWWKCYVSWNLDASEAGGSYKTMCGAPREYEGSGGEAPTSHIEKGEQFPTEYTFLQ